MIVNADHTRKQLLDIWPNFPTQNIWLPSGPYYLPTIEEAKSLVVANRVDSLPFKRHVRECEKFAAFLYADIQRKVAEIYDYTHSIGIVIGDNIKSNPAGGTHTCNIVFTRSGVFLIEPQNCMFWSPVGPITSIDQNDFLFYLYM